MNTGHVEQHGQGSVRSHVHHGSLVDHANQIGYMDWHLVSVHLDGNIIIIIIIIIFFHNSWIEMVSQFSKVKMWLSLREMF